MLLLEGLRCARLWLRLWWIISLAQASITRARAWVASVCSALLCFDLTQQCVSIRYKEMSWSEDEEERDNILDRITNHIVVAQVKMLSLLLLPACDVYLRRTTWPPFGASSTETVAILLPLFSCVWLTQRAHLVKAGSRDQSRLLLQACVNRHLANSSKLLQLHGRYAAFGAWTSLGWQLVQTRSPTNYLIRSWLPYVVGLPVRVWFCSLASCR